MKAGPFSCSVWTSRPFYTAGVAILTISSLLPTALAQNLTDGQIADVSGRLTTAAQARYALVVYVSSLNSQKSLLDLVGNLGLGHRQSSN